MDQSTHEVRIAYWKKVIEQCQARPEGQTTKQWLSDNGIPEKQYYYWLRKIRKQAFDESQSLLPAVTCKKESDVAFVEFPAETIIPSEAEPAVTIKTKKSTIQISSAVSEDLVIKLVKVVAHAL